MTEPGALDCAACRSKLHDFALGALADAEAEAVSAHVKHCAPCQGALAKEREWAMLVSETQATGPPVTVKTEVFSGKARRWLPAPLVALAICVSLAFVALLVAALLRARESARVGASAGNLKHLAIVFRLYAQDAQGKYPPPAPVDGILVPNLRLLFPKYVVDPGVFINPRLPDPEGRYERMLRALEDTPPNWDAAHRIIAEGYTYLPWATKELDDFLQLAERYSDVEDRDADLLAEDGSVALYRLKDGVERFFITAEESVSSPVPTSQKQKDLPILFEVVPLPHQGEDVRGCNVLFMDGHVEFVKYGERYPVLPEVAEFLAREAERTREPTFR